MKNYIYIILFLGISNFAKSQVGINTNTPHPSAALDINSNNKGITIPKYNLTSLTSNVSPITQPAIGLMIYNTGNTFPKGIYYWIGSKWEKFHVQGDFNETFSISIPGSIQGIVTSSLTNDLPNFIVDANNISGSIAPNVNTSNGIITLPKGKYRVFIKLDGGWASRGDNWIAGGLNSYYKTSSGINYQNISVNAVLQNDNNVNITEVQNNNMLVGNSGLFGGEFNFWLDLKQDSNNIKLRLYYDTTSNTLANTPNMTPHQTGLKVTFTRMQ